MGVSNHRGWILSEFRLGDNSRGRKDGNQVTRRMNWEKSQRDGKVNRAMPSKWLGRAKGSKRRDDSPRPTGGTPGKKTVLPWETPVVGKRERRTDDGL